MQALHIKQAHRTISVDLASDVISIDINDQDGAPISGGLEWSDTLLSGETVTQEAAEKAVAALGPGWRLPTYHELISLVDTSRHDPCIDVNRFPDTKSKYYWTGTECAWDTSYFWVVGFTYGYVGSGRRDCSACVRAVRSGQ